MNAREAALELGRELSEEMNFPTDSMEAHDDAFYADRASLRLRTRNRALDPEMMQVLGDRGYALEYLGTEESGVRPKHIWLVKTDGQYHENLY
jgi:hypothetical protein